MQAMTSTASAAMAGMGTHQDDDPADEGTEETRPQLPSLGGRKRKGGTSKRKRLVK